MKVLLVRLSSMGDLVHTLYAVEDLKTYRPDIELHWLCEKAFTDIPRLHPFVQRVYEFSWRKYRKNLFKINTWRTMFNQIKLLQKEKYDQVIDSQGLLKSALVAKLIKAPVHGFSKSSAREKWASTFYDHTHTVLEADNVIWKNRQLFALAFGYREKIKREKNSLNLTIPPDTKLDFPVENAFHVAVYGTSGSYKLWPIENWRVLLKQRNRLDGKMVYLTWGNEQEKTAVELLAQGLDFIKVCPKMTLLQVALLLSKSDSVVAVDTGLLHLANALSIPTLGIYPNSSASNTRLENRPWAKIVHGVKSTSNIALVGQKWQESIEAGMALKGNT